MNKELSLSSFNKIISSTGVEELVFDGNLFDDLSFSLIIKSNEKINILFVNLKDGSSFDIVAKEDTNINLSIFLKNNDKSVKFNVNLLQNAYINSYCADFSDGKNSSEFIFNLNSENAKCDWHLASLTSSKDNKNLTVSINHNFANTIATVDNYGVCKGESKLTFAGTSYIAKGSHGSKTRQNAKIMVFDLASDASAKPILKIDENDVEASHGAVVGKINDEHMFYLTSRGLSFNDARSLITMGYLKPILKGFFNEKYIEEITSLIEGKI